MRMPSDRQTRSHPLPALLRQSVRTISVNLVVADSLGGVQDTVSALRIGDKAPECCAMLLAVSTHADDVRGARSVVDAMLDVSAEKPVVVLVEGPSAWASAACLVLAAAADKAYVDSECMRFGPYERINPALFSGQASLWHQLVADVADGRDLPPRLVDQLRYHTLVATAAIEAGLFDGLKDRKQLRRELSAKASYRQQSFPPPGPPAGPAPVQLAAPARG